jgi:hypothetical protein
VVEQQHPVGELAHRVEGVRDVDDRVSAFDQVLERRHALAPEELVADRQHLVEEQEVGIDLERRRECEPDLHPR